MPGLKANASSSEVLISITLANLYVRVLRRAQSVQYGITRDAPSPSRTGTRSADGFPILRFDPRLRESERVPDFELCVRLGAGAFVTARAWPWGFTRSRGKLPRAISRPDVRTLRV